MKRRELLVSMGGMALAGLAADGIAVEGKPAKAKAAKVTRSNAATATPALKQAWDEYHATLEEMRKELEATPPFQNSPKDRAKAYHTLMEMQAMAYNFAVAPRMLHPRLYYNLCWQSDSYTLGQNGQDWLYSMAFLDGAQRYKLAGRMGDISLMLCQTFNGLFGELGVKTTGNYDWGDFKVDADGRFEAIVSATKEPGNWIQIDPKVGYQMLFFRRALTDWMGDAGELKIERISEVADDHYYFDEFDEGAMAKRIRRATNFIKFVNEQFTIHLYDDYLSHADGQFNKLTLRPGTSTGQVGSPSANYAQAIFDLKDDEAVIIEMPKVPDGAYWSFQLGDVWSRSLDFANHQSSMNMREVAVDADGAIRIVVSINDPGINNWLDTCAHHSGTVVFRNYRSMTAPVPASRKVKLSEVMDLLPKETKLMSAAERKQAMDRRRMALVKRWGE